MISNQAASDYYAYHLMPTIFDSEADMVILLETDIVEDMSYDNADSDDWGRGLQVIEWGEACPEDPTATILESQARPLPIDAAPSGEICYETNTSGFSRPEYLYARAFKPKADSPVGIFMSGRKGRVRITKIDRNGIFGRSNLRPGDQIMSVNGVSSRRLTANQVALQIKNAKRHVSLTVRNENGNPNVVSSCVQKPTAAHLVGLGFKNRMGALHISRVDAKGLFGDSLIMKGHRCVMINGIPSPNTPSQDAASWVKSSKDFVTIISRPNPSSAMVLACETDRVWLTRAAVSMAVAAGIVGAIQTLSH